MGGGNFAWGDTELVNIDFTDEGSISFAAGESKTIDGITVYSKAATSITANGLRSAGTMSTSTNWFAIPISGIDGSIFITLTSNTNQPQFSYYIADYENLPASYDNPSSIITPSKPSSGIYSLSINHATSSKNAVLYFGLGGSYQYIKTIVVKSRPKVTTKWSFGQFEGCQSDDGDKELVLGNEKTGILDYNGLFIHNSGTYKIYAQSVDGNISLYSTNGYNQGPAQTNAGSNSAHSIIGFNAYAFWTTGAGKVTVKAYSDATGDAVWLISGGTTRSTLSFGTANTHVTAEYDATGVETIWIVPAKSNVWIEEIKFVPTSASTTTKTLTIGEAGYATFSASENYTWNTSDYPDLKAYYVSAVSEGNATLTEITAANGIPAGTGVIFQGDEGCYTLTSTESVTPLAGINYLRANLVDYTLKANNSTSSDAATSWNYTLAAGPIFKHSTGIGTLAAGKAFLRTNVNATALARGLNLVFDDGNETTGISDASRLMDNGKMRNENFFNLKGQRVTQPTKGLYIKNGKKVAVK